MEVQIREVKRKEGLFRVVQSGLGIAVVVDDEDDSPADMTEALVRPVQTWRKKRGDKAMALSLTFSAPREMHIPIEASFFQLYKREDKFQFVINRLQSLSITLCEEDGTPVRAYTLDVIGLMAGRYRRNEEPLERALARHERRKALEAQKQKETEENDEEDSEEAEDDEETADAET